MTLENMPSDDLWKLLSVFDDLLAIEEGLKEVLPRQAFALPYALNDTRDIRREVILELFERQAGL